MPQLFVGKEIDSVYVVHILVTNLEENSGLRTTSKSYPSFYGFFDPEYHMLYLGIQDIAIWHPNTFYD